MKSVFVSAAFVLAAIPFSSLPAQADVSCRTGVFDSTPSINTRTVETASYKIEIPANYRAELSSYDDERVSIYDPDQYQYLTCVRAQPGGTGIHNFITVELDNGRVNGRGWPYISPNFRSMASSSTLERISYLRVGEAMTDAAITRWDSPFHGVMSEIYINSRWRAGIVVMKTDDMPAIMMNIADSIIFK